MSFNRDVTVQAITLLIKDSKAIGRSFWLIYNPLIVGLFAWTAIDPTSGFSLIPVSSEVSPTSHFIGEFAIVNAFLTPFVFYTSVIYESLEQERAGSFVVSRIFPINAAVEDETRAPRSIRLQAFTTDAVQLFWARVFSCSTLSLVSFLFPYLFYLCLHLFGLLPEDNLTPILVSVRFPVFITSLALLASALAVGIGLNPNRKWSLLMATIVILPVLFGGVIFDALLGGHYRHFFIKLLEVYGFSLSAPVVFVGLSLLMGQLFKTTLRQHNARTR